MKVLYVGGSGEISQACVEQAQLLGHRVTVFNRGLRSETLPEGVEQVVGDIADDAIYARLAARNFDVVCQFLVYDPKMVQRDIEFFTGHCQQYIFISTASAYQKPCQNHIITESVPLDNPFWSYSRSKAACENLLLQAHDAGKLPVTIVRPSHTYRTRLPSTVIDGDHLAWRLVNNKPVILHGDGESLWTLTHATDFAKAFVKINCNVDALGEAVHITCSDGHTWNVIYGAVAKLLNKEPVICMVLSSTIVGYNAAWQGPLLGDKSNSVLFDNSKVRRLTGGWRCKVSLAEGLQQVWPHVLKRLEQGYQPDQKIDALIDRIIDEQQVKG